VLQVSELGPSDPAIPNLVRHSHGTSSPNPEDLLSFTNFEAMPSAHKKFQIHRPDRRNNGATALCRDSFRAGRRTCFLAFAAAKTPKEEFTRTRDLPQQREVPYHGVRSQRRDASGSGLLTLITDLSVLVYGYGPIGGKRANSARNTRG